MALNDVLHRHISSAVKRGAADIGLDALIN